MTNCKDKFEIPDGLSRIFNKPFAVGEIDECKYKGELVYVAGSNYYDAGSAVYDKHGNSIGTCNYAWGPVDSLCKQLTNCEVIYRVKDHITGLPSVDKYKLTKKRR